MQLREVHLLAQGHTAPGSELSAGPHAETTLHGRRQQRAASWGSWQGCPNEASKQPSKAVFPKDLCDRPRKRWAAVSACPVSIPPVLLWGNCPSITPTLWGDTPLTPGRVLPSRGFVPLARVTGSGMAL